MGTASGPDAVLTLVPASGLVWRSMPFRHVLACGGAAPCAARSRIYTRRQRDRVRLEFYDVQSECREYRPRIQAQEATLEALRGQVAGDPP
jgi:hypothetical protein